MPQRTITHRARLETCLAGSKPDRIPVALWRHFPVDDQSAGTLAAATIHYQETYRFDVVKVSPASSYCLKDWGIQDEWRGATEGTRDYTRRVIEHPDDWERLPVLDPRSGSLGEMLVALQQITTSLGSHTPVIQTIFNPLSQAKNLAGRGKLLTHLRKYPAQVETGLKIITESTQRFIEAAKSTGIGGVFFAVQHAQYPLLTEKEYRIFGAEFDLQVLETTSDLWLNVLHLHGDDIMFDLCADYPVQVINWHDQETPPNLAEALHKTTKTVCGGLRREQSLIFGTPEMIRAEAARAIQATGGQRFILGTGCVLPIIVPHGNILAVTESAAEYKPA